MVLLILFKNIHLTSVYRYSPIANSITSYLQEKKITEERSNWVSWIAVSAKYLFQSI